MNYFSQQLLFLLLLLLLIIIIIIFMTSKRCTRGPVKYACAPTEAINVCGSLRCHRCCLFRSTTDFSRIFLALSTTLQSATLYLPPLHQTFRPLSSSFRCIFILLHWFPLLSPYFRKILPAVSCCRRAIKDNRNISIFLFSVRS
jgi:hypothetical protein